MASPKLAPRLAKELEPILAGQRPKVLRVVEYAGYRIPVVLVDRLSADASTLEHKPGESLAGATLILPAEGYMVFLSRECPKETWPRTLLHELCHVFDRVGGYELGEAGVSALENFLMHFAPEVGKALAAEAGRAASVLELVGKTE